MAASNTRIVFLGADTYCGQSIIREWAKINPEQVRQMRAVIHSQNQSAQQALKQLGINHISQSDYQNESNLANEFERCNFVVLCPPVEQAFTKEHATMAVKASKQANVQNAILLSCVGLDAPNPPRMFKDCHSIESLIKQHFENNVVLRLDMPAQLFDFCVPHIQNTGNLHLNTGNGRFAPIDLADVAKVLSHLVKNHSLESNVHGQVYQLTGPHALNGNEIAECMRKVGRGQKPRNYQHVNRQELEREMNNIYQQAGSAQGQRQQQTGMGMETRQTGRGQQQQPGDRMQGQQTGMGMETRQTGRGQQQQSSGKMQGQQEIPQTITEKPSLDGYKHTINWLLDYCDLVQRNEIVATTKDVQQLVRSPPTQLEEYFKRESQVYNQLA